MSRAFGAAAFAVGLAAVGWVGLGYAGSNPLALTMTALIGAFYAMGALELLRFQQATATLNHALSTLAAQPQPLPGLGGWLGQLHPSLQNPVRQRVEGERVGLPGPALTPYLVGLLVLLGMLGTFLGMVVTLNGAVMALESTTDLPTIRAALAAPVKGLGLAFGTSVAGVAASAMLGLMAALCRRERAQAAQALDLHIATTLRGFTLARQRQDMLEALQQQARQLPEAMGQMQALMLQMAQHSERFHERLLASQDRFHGHAQEAYRALASSVDLSLKQSLAESAHAAGATIQPVVEATMAGLAREAAGFQDRIAGTLQRQWEAWAQGFEQRASTLLATVEGQHLGWRAELQAAALEQARQQAALRAEAAAAEGRRLAAWTQSLQSTADALQREWQQAGARSLAQQQQVCQTLEQTAGALQAQAEANARSTLAELSTLVDAASAAPQAAAELVGQWREQLSDSLRRDNELLEERTRILGALDALLDTVSRAATEQRGAIGGLVASAAALLEQAGTRFGNQVEADAARMATAAAHVTGSAVEISSLGEALGVAVQLFGASTEALTVHLQRLEGALGRSTARSDEQLAYYVAQAREIIDLSLSSQKQIVQDLQQLAPRRDALAAGAAA